MINSDTLKDSMHWRYEVHTPHCTVVAVLLQCFHLYCINIHEVICTLANCSGVVDWKGLFIVTRKGQYSVVNGKETERRRWRCRHKGRKKLGKSDSKKDPNPNISLPFSPAYWGCLEDLSQVLQWGVVVQGHCEDTSWSTQLLSASLPKAVQLCPSTAHVF